MRKTELELREDGKRAAAERWASMTPEVRLVVEASLARMHSRFVHMFVGEEGDNPGHMPGMVATSDELREFRKLHPATHRWAALENSLDL